MATFFEERSAEVRRIASIPGPREAVIGRAQAQRYRMLIQPYPWESRSSGFSMEPTEGGTRVRLRWDPSFDQQIGAHDFSLLRRGAAWAERHHGLGPEMWGARRVRDEGPVLIYRQGGMLRPYAVIGPNQIDIRGATTLDEARAIARREYPGSPIEMATGRHPAHQGSLRRGSWRLEPEQATALVPVAERKWPEAPPEATDSYGFLLPNGRIVSWGHRGSIGASQSNVQHLDAARALGTDLTSLMQEGWARYYGFPREVNVQFRHPITPAQARTLREATEAHDRTLLLDASVSTETTYDTVDGYARNALEAARLIRQANEMYAKAGHPAAYRLRREGWARGRRPSSFGWKLGGAGTAVVAVGALVVAGITTAWVEQHTGFGQSPTPAPGPCPLGTSLASDGSCCGPVRTDGTTLCCAPCVYDTIPCAVPCFYRGPVS